MICGLWRDLGMSERVWIENVEVITDKMSDCCDTVSLGWVKKLKLAGCNSAISGFLDPVTIYQKRKELLEIRWWQNDRNFKSFSDWQRYLRRPQRTKSKGPKDLQLKVGIRKASRLLVVNTDIFCSLFFNWSQYQCLKAPYLLLTHFCGTTKM